LQQKISWNDLGTVAGYPAAMPTEGAESPQTQRDPRSRRSFLLRCWHEQASEQEGRWVWRFSVREVTEEPDEVILRSPGALVDFLIENLTDG
jgi:hypothetical protein